MNSTTFPRHAHPQTKNNNKTLTLTGGLAQLRQHLGGSRLVSYVKDHEAWALILLAIFLVAGTIAYVDFQPRLGAGDVQNPSSAHS